MRKTAKLLATKFIAPKNEPNKLVKHFQNRKGNLKAILCRNVDAEKSKQTCRNSPTSEPRDRGCPS